MQIILLTESFNKLHNPYKPNTEYWDVYQDVVHACPNNKTYTTLKELSLFTGYSVKHFEYYLPALELDGHIIII